MMIVISDRTKQWKAEERCLCTLCISIQQNCDSYFFNVFLYENESILLWNFKIALYRNIKGTVSFLFMYFLKLFSIL